MNRVKAAHRQPVVSTEITLLCTPAAVPAVRRFVREALPAGSRADDLVLAVDELASNSVTHSSSGRGGEFTVTVRTAAGSARVEVTDDGPASGPPALSNGWGLEIVRAVTDRAGTTVGLDGRRTAWAEVTWPAL